jgi:hypothetical protein
MSLRCDVKLTSGYRISKIHCFTGDFFFDLPEPGRDIEIRVNIVKEVESRGRKVCQAFRLFLVGLDNNKRSGGERPDHSSGTSIANIIALSIKNLVNFPSTSSR